jgi:protein ImuB
MRRILSIWLPYWATDRLIRDRARRGLEVPNPAVPLVLTEARQGTQRLARVNRAALDLGLRPEMALADARALVPGLLVQAAAPEADRQALQRLADWCGRYGPWVAVDGADGIKLEITGTAHLFGGEAALLADLEARLAGFTLTARGAVADSLGAAWGLARFAPAAWTAVPADALEDAVAGLPVAALRLPAEIVESLHRLGLDTVRNLMGAPSAPFAARFGPGLVRRLAQALDREAEPVSPDRPAAEFLARLVFPEPIGSQPDIVAAATRLVEELAALLAAREMGARRLELTLYLADGGVRRLAIGCSRPSRDPAHLGRLLEERASGLEAGFGADVMTLAAPAVESLATAQLTLGRIEAAASGSADARSLAEDAELGLLIDRLGNRLGFRNVARLAPHESRLPERALRVVAPLAPAQGGIWGPDLPRPVQLLPAPELVETVAEVPDGPPVRFRWRGRTHRVARADGPERIAPEWWRQERDGGKPARVRDYYRLEDQEGARFWIYRDGLFGAEETPRWYLHGLFA